MKRLFILLSAVVGLASCQSEKRMQANGYTQGTTYSVIYFNDGLDYQYQIDSLLLAFDRVLSTYQESSYISKWNRGEALNEQPQMFTEILVASNGINSSTNGAFDITVAPLMKFWFERDWNVEELDSATIDSLMLFVGIDKIAESNGVFMKSDSNVQIDVNAIAQGYSVDVLASYLESKDVFNYLVEIGGEVRASGFKANQEPWKVGIYKPSEGNVERELAMSVELKDRALATSGNYRKFVVVNGQKFGHTLNPRTGYPAKTDVLSATVFANNCMTADAFATALMVLGYEKARTLVDSNEMLDAILIYSNTSGEVKTWDSRKGN